MACHLSDYRTVLIPAETVKQLHLRDCIDQKNPPEYAQWFGIIFRHATTGNIIHQDNIFETRILLKRHFNSSLPKPNVDVRRLKGFGPTPDLEGLFSEKFSTSNISKCVSLQDDHGERKSGKFVAVKRSTIINTLGITYEKRRQSTDAQQQASQPGPSRNKLACQLKELGHRIIDKIRSIPKPKSFADAITQACPSEAGAELPPSRRHNRRPASMKMLFMSKSSVQSRASFMDPIVLQYYRRSEEGRESINRATAIRPATVQRRRSHFCCCK